MPRLLQVALVGDSAQIRERLVEALAATEGVSVAFQRGGLIDPCPSPEGQPPDCQP